MKYTISTEEELSAYPNNVHMRFFNETVQKGFWKQASNLSLFYAYAMHPHSKGCVVVSQGRAESVVKYAELIYDLYQNQFSVFIADHQGQGLSTRTQSNPHIGYVENFCDYVNDLHALIGHVLAPILKSANQDSLPINLLCHSMGGAIGCLYAQRFPQTFNKIAMSAPMVGIKAPLSETLMSIILSVHRLSKRLFNIKESYFWGQGDYQAYPFYKNRLTNSEARYRVFRQTLADFPENQLGGISMKWLQEAIKAMQEIRANAHKIVSPCLVLIAQEEQIVDNNRLRDFADSLPNVVIKEVENAQHEIFFEQDEARTTGLNEIIKFFEKNEQIKC